MSLGQAMRDVTISPQRILSPVCMPRTWHWANVGMAFKSLSMKSVTSLTFLVSIAAALASHGRTPHDGASE